MPEFTEAAGVELVTANDSAHDYESLWFAADGHGIPVCGGAEQRADHAAEELDERGGSDVPIRQPAAADLGGDDGAGVGPEFHVRWILREPDGTVADQGDGAALFGGVRSIDEPSARRWRLRREREHAECARGD